MIWLTARGMKDGIVHPRERRPTDSIHTTLSWEMPSIEETVVHAKIDTEKDLNLLGNHTNLSFAT